MPYFKIDLHTNNYNTRKFAVVHAQKANYPYYQAYTIADGYEGSNIWDLARTNRYSMNEWFYIYFSKSKENKLLIAHGLNNSTYKFNNTVYQINSNLVTSISPCTRKFYNEHKDLIGKVEKGYTIRDSQKNRAYRGEIGIKQVGTLSNSEVMEFVNQVINSEVYSRFSAHYIDFFQDKPTELKVELNPRGKTWARGGQFGLTLPDWSKSEFVILHELSHLIIARMFDYGAKREQKIQGHGQEWCFVFLYLVQEFMDDDYFYGLLKGYEKNKVNYLMEFMGLSL